MRVITVLAAALLWSAPAFAQFAQQGSKLVGTGAAGNAMQGQAVSLSSDGNTAIVGGPGDNGGAGAVWIWTRSGTTWTQQGPKLVGSGAIGAANQGYAVSLSADGNTAIVGGYQDNGGVGAAWIFTRSAGTWAQLGGKLVGSGAVGPSQQGASVAISADGATAVVGGFGDNAFAGAAWIFIRSGGNSSGGAPWTQQGSKLAADNAIGTTARQGVSVAISGNGNTVFVGGSGDNSNVGAAWVFMRNGATWFQDWKMTGSGASGSAAFGQSVAVSADGLVAVIGASNDSSALGAVWTFARGSGFFPGGFAWVQKGAKFLGTGSTGSPVYQGKAVALSGNGAVAIESGNGDGGTPATGAAWIFTRTTAETYTQVGAKLVGSGAVDGPNGANQGFSSFLSSDGQTAIVGGYRDNADAGAAWIFAATPPALPPHAAADFDGDHKADLTVFKYGGDWATLKSSGGFTSSSTVHFDGGTVPESHFPLRGGGDYDGDGKQDPALYNPGTGVWLIALSGSNYSATLTLNWGGNGFIPVPGDYDGDGKTNIATYSPVTGLWSIVAFQPGGFFFVTNISWGGIGYTPVPGRDFDGDGISDLAVYQQSTGLWSILKSSTGFTTATNLWWGGPGYSLVPGDYDGDGKTDPALYQRSTGSWYILRSDAGYTTTITVNNWGGIGYMPVPGDYDGDRKFDLAVYQRSSGNWFVLTSTTSYATALPTMSWGSGTDVPLSTAIDLFGSDAARATDTDGDGRAEITVYNAASGVWSSRTSSSGYAGATNRGWGGPSYLPVPGDYDGDGKADLGVYVQASGDWYVLLSGAAFTTSLSRNVGGAGWTPVPGDYDGDGKTDLVGYNTTTGEWRGLVSSTLYTTTVSVMNGGAGFTPVPGDYDGDGMTDPATYQGSSGNWSIKLSSSNYTTSMTGTLGGSGYMAVPSDYDGDGRTDIIVYNTTNGLWTGYLSGYGLPSDFTPAFKSFMRGWGGTGYTPVKGDYDGDGKADLALYQPSTGNWYILITSTNYASTIGSSWGGPGYGAPSQFP